MVHNAVVLVLLLQMQLFVIDLLIKGAVSFLKFSGGKKKKKKVLLCSFLRPLNMIYDLSQKVYFLLGGL